MPTPSLAAGQRLTAAGLGVPAWTPITFANSWSNQVGRVACQYRLVPLINCVEVIGWIAHGSTSGSSAINAAVPSAYWPVSEQVIPVMPIVATNVYASSTEATCLDIGTSGIFTLAALPAGTTQVTFHGHYSLDA